MAPTSSQMKPNIATRASRRVPLRLSSVVHDDENEGDHGGGDRGALERRTAARETAQRRWRRPPWCSTAPSRRPSRPSRPSACPTRRRAQGYRPPEIGNCETISPNTRQTISCPRPTQNIVPPHRRPARDEGGGEQRVDAHHRREVGEPQGEIFPLRHRAVEMGNVAQGAQLLGIAIGRSSLSPK